ncbi:MAG TPA: class E sortase [Nocardioides sp.]|nr:class E sortase [Nocardioides sp.]
MPRRRTALWLGRGAVTVGLALLALVAWQYVGTNVLSERRHSELVDDIRRSWESPVPAVRRMGKEPSAAGVDTRPEERVGGSALVRIPRFGVDYVMPVVEGTDEEALANGIGHHVGTAAVGEVGNYVLAGHRVTHGEPLSRMPSLRPGDVVEVETRRMVYTYVLDTEPDQLVVDDDADWVLDPRPVNPVATGPQPSREPRLITLVSCAEIFRTDERMVVFGHLARISSK